MEVVQTKEHVDAIGFAITQISAIAIAARAKAGLINGIDLLVYTVLITCEAYPGKVGTDTRLIGYLPGRPEPRVPYEQAIANTDALTSRGVAIAALPELRTRPV